MLVANARSTSGWAYGNEIHLAGKTRLKRHCFVDRDRLLMNALPKSMTTALRDAGCKLEAFPPLEALAEGGTAEILR